MAKDNGSQQRLGKVAGVAGSVAGNCGRYGVCVGCGVCGERGRGIFLCSNEEYYCLDCERDFGSGSHQNENLIRFARTELTLKR